MWKAGDRVLGQGTATFAEHAVARADEIATLPPDLPAQTAAAIPLAGCTALQCLEAADPAEPGGRILINGASGGVGTFAVLARGDGAACHGGGEPPARRCSRAA